MTEAQANQSTTQTSTENGSSNQAANQASETSDNASSTNSEPTLADELSKVWTESENKSSDVSDKTPKDKPAKQTQKEVNSDGEKETNESSQEEGLLDEEDSEEGQSSSESEEGEDEIQKTVEKELPLIPKDWSAEEKEVFERMLASDDPEIQLAAAVFSERYNNMKKGLYKNFQQNALKIKEQTHIENLFKPYEHNLKQHNITRADYITKLIDIDKRFTANPAELIKEMVSKYKLTPQQLGIKVDSFDLDDEEDLTDKKNNGNNEEIAQLKNEVRRLQNQVEINPIKVQVEQFASEKTPEGKLKHPHFKQVQKLMGTLISQDSNLTLDKAYVKAVKIEELDTSSSSDLPETKPSNIDAIKQRIANAKKASKTVKSTGNRRDTSNMTLAEELASNWSEK